MTRALSFDIETVPQIAPLSSAQEEELNRKLEKAKPRDANETYEDIKSRIMGTNPYYGEIVCIGMGYESGNNSYVDKALIGDEKDILKEFWDIIAKFNGTFVSYNGLDFDVWFIVIRTMLHKLRITNRNFIFTKRFQTHPHFDLKPILADWDKWRSVSLHIVCDHLGIPSPKEGEIKAKDVAKAYAEGRIDDIAKYCLKDVKATYDVYQIVKDYV